MSERRYDPKTIEPKWQEVWQRERTWEVSNEVDQKQAAMGLAPSGGRARERAAPRDEGDALDVPEFIPPG